MQLPFGDPLFLDTPMHFHQIDPCNAVNEISLRIIHLRWLLPRSSIESDHLLLGEGSANNERNLIHHYDVSFFFGGSIQRAIWAHM